MPLEFDPEIGKDLGLKRVIVLLDLLRASRAHHQSYRDVGRRRELKRGGAQIDAVPGGNRSELLPLFDRGSGDLEIFLAVVVARATGNEAGIQRGANDERDVLPPHNGEKLVDCCGVIDQ